MLTTTETSRPPRSLDDLLSPDFVARITRLDLASRKVFAGRMKGERRSKKRGESVEFADHRPYVAGDDLRRLDWHIYGRLDRLFTKLFQEEEDLSLHVVLDCSASMNTGEPSKFRFAQQAAAALGYIGLVNYNRVGLAAIGGVGAASDSIEGAGKARIGGGGVVSSLSRLRGRRRAREMGDWLCSLDPVGATDFAEAAKRIALTRQGKGVMVVISDFFFKEGYEQGLRYLVGRGYDVFICQTLSPQEMDPPLGGDLRLKDIEDADRAEVTISAPLLKRYKDNLAAYCDQLRAFCARRDMMHLLVTSDTSLEDLILERMRRGGLLT